MTKTTATLICLSCGLLLHGCVAELVGPELAAGEATIGVEAGVEAGASAASELELGGAGVETEIRSGLLRAQPRAMSAFLEQITEDGVARPALEIDRIGRISLKGRQIAIIRGEGEIVSEIQGRATLVGRIFDGRIWEVTTEGGLASAIGEIGGYIPGDGLFLRAGPSPFSARVGLLHSDVIADVLQLKDGWYEIRLRSGTTGWIRAPFLAIVTTLYAANKRKDGDSEAAGPRVFLTSGRVLRATKASENQGAIVAVGADGLPIVLDRSLLAEERRLQWDWGSHAEHITLSNGFVLLASLRQKNEGAALLDLPNGEHVTVDNLLLKDHGTAGELPNSEATSQTRGMEDELPVPETSSARIQGPCRIPLSVKPEDAGIYLDGSFVGTGSDLKEHGLELTSGAHSLSVVRPGYLETEMDVQGCQKKPLEIVLERDPG
jgi:hypothetical protein